MKALAIAIWAVTLFSAAPTLAQFYRYVDANGHVRFTDDINQVPEKQRVAARSYVESPGAPKAGDESADPKAPAATAPVEVAVAAPAATEDPSDSARGRIDDMKKQVEAQYQALLKEKDALAKEKETRKTREQVADYNKRVEAFNQSAGAYEAKSNDLRKLVDEYNARVMEENAKAAKPVQK
jgi:Skp family chaperone for outer membrane proteins